MIYGLALAVAVVPFVFLTIAMRRTELASGYPAAAASVFAFTYIAVPMALLVQIRQQPAGAILVIYTLLVVWAGDVFAYFVGKAIGRHRMSPEISPKKTWEGAVASVLASVVVDALVSDQRGSALASSAGLTSGGMEMFGFGGAVVGLIVALSGVNIAAQLGFGGVTG
jgi:phosphatidate cytidylyltransferase